MRNFRELKVYNEALALAILVYRFIDSIPSKEEFALKSQFRRAVTSIALNISEGSSKSSNKHLKNYLEHSLGSAYEIETLLILTNQIYGLESGEIQEKNILLQRMIVSLIKAVN